MMYEGDCLRILPTLPSESVDAVITDPPYGMSYQSSWRIDKTSRFAKIAGDDAPFVWFLPEAVRILRDGGILLCFCRWDSAEAFHMAIQWAGLKVRGQLVWDRIGHGMGDLTSSPAPQHDIIWFATKGKYRFPGGRPKSVLRHQRLAGVNLTHPNEKPEDLMTDLVLSYTSPGQIVLDPFCGSGTTGVAAVRNGRAFIGVELDPAYCEIAKQRIMEAEGIEQGVAA